MVVLSVVSAKGGVGKTTLATNLASAFSLNNMGRIVVLDLDPLNAIGLHMGFNVREMDGVSRATLEQRSWGTCIFKHAGTSLLPYGCVNEADRDALEMHLSKNPDWLLTGLRGLNLAGTDLVIIDTPPGASCYQRQALAAAHFTLVVMNADPASYATLPAMESLIEKYCEGRQAFIGSAYILNNVHPSSKLSKDMIKVLRANLPNRLVPALVHQDEAVKEALAFDQSVLKYAPNSEATGDILKLADWLLRQMKILLDFTPSSGAKKRYI